MESMCQENRNESSSKGSVHKAMQLSKFRYFRLKGEVALNRDQGEVKDSSNKIMREMKEVNSNYGAMKIPYSRYQKKTSK